MRLLLEAGACLGLGSTGICEGAFNGLFNYGGTLEEAWGGSVIAGSLREGDDRSSTSTIKFIF